MDSISNPPPPVNPGHLPGQSQVQSVLQHNVGGSVFERLTRGSSPSAGDTNSVPSQPVPQNPSSAPPSPSVPVEPAPAVQAVAPAAEPKASSPVPESEPVDPELQELEKGSVAENFKKLRTKYRGTKQALTEKDRELTETKQKLEKYEKGEAVPDVFKEQQTRIATLEKYEKIYALESSPEFHQKYIAPLEDVKTKLHAIADSYGIPKDELEKVLSIENIAERNRFLSEHFDEFGGLEVAKLWDTNRELQKGISEAKKAPDVTLSSLLDEARDRRELEQVRAREKIAKKTTTSWSRSLQRIQQEGWAKELIPRDGDTEFNDNIVKPIISRAADEHGKIINALAEAGLSDISDDLSDALARQTLLAHASSVAIESRNNILKAYNELEENTRRGNSVVRPSIGSTFQRTAPAAKSDDGPLTPEAAAKRLRQQVIG